MTVSLPPVDGTLPTIPDFVDFQATHNPDLPWYIFLSKDLPGELVSITYREMAEASHRVAHILRPNRQDPDGEVVALLLNTDTILYNAVVLGLLRAGLVVLKPYPMSPRNSPQGICHMLEAVSCTRILGQASTGSLIHQVRSDMQAKGVLLQIDELPGLPQVFPKLCGDVNEAAENISSYPASSKSIDMHAPSIYMHSSGSTGHPKSIHFTFHRMLQWMTANPFGKSRDVRFGAIGLPSFHGMGLLLQVNYPLTTGREVVVYTPQWPAPPIVPNPQNVYEVAKLTKCTALMALPSFIQAWSHSAEVIEYLKTLRILIYGGGPLALSTGNKLIQSGIALRNGYGGTEFGCPFLAWDDIPHTSTKADPDWAWYRLPPEAHNVKFEPQGDGTYELVIHEVDTYHVAVYNVPGTKAYATADLFEPHPTKPGLWKIVGRRDDVITLSNGEKIVPTPQEGSITSSPLVSGCIMFGREHEQPGILIEPQPEHAIDPYDEVTLVTFRTKIWERIEQANAQAPGFAKIFKEMIIVTDTDRPLPRSGKGTIIRKQALAIYSEEIEKLYEAVSASMNNQGISPPRSWEIADVEPWLVDHATNLVSHDAPISPTVDLFQQGFDSLSATFFRNRIIGALRSSNDVRIRKAAQNVSPNFVFACPTINQLAVAVAALVYPPSASALQARSVVDDIRVMIAKYTADLPIAQVKAKTRADDAPVVLLTGSTGNIGSHILAYLLSEDRVKRVYALNRPSADPLGRLKSAFSDRNLPEEILDDSRLVSLVGDVARDNFGLQEMQYKELLGSVTHIIHNAWTVNFNLALQFFEDQVAGVRRLIDISARSEHPIKLLVTSSIGIANGWDPAKGPVPESLLPDPEIAASIGYTASKHVIEHILDVATANGIPATAVRMGQACGPKETGAWGTTEWMPILTKSSIALGCLPAMTGSVAWVPLDAIGQTYVDWIMTKDDLPALVNVVHPCPTTWDVVLRGICQELGDSLPVVPVEEWLDKLEALAKDPGHEDLTRVPALKIMDFFRSLRHSARKDGEPNSAAGAGAMDLAYETSELLLSSPTMRELQPMSEEHARAWVRYWKSRGFVV